VQAVSVTLSLSPPWTPVLFQIIPLQAQTQFFHNIILSLQGGNPDVNTFVGMQPIMWILDPTTTAVRCFEAINTTNPALAVGTYIVTGYLQ
jgi:hypothetical protein